MVRSGKQADLWAERTPSALAVLAAALAVTAAPGAALAQTASQPVPQSGPQAQQGEIVLLEADVVTDDEAQQIVTAEGDVQLRYGQRTMRADRLDYNLSTGLIHATGDVQIVDESGSIQYAEEVELDPNLNIGVATELRARFGATGRLAARSAVRRGEGRNELRRVVYTSCPICEGTDRPPTWTIRARRAVQDQDNRTISYRGAVLEIVGVPLVYIPYFAHSDPSVGRASGLLTPSIGSNDRLGLNYEQPYFWAISPSQDATFSLMASENVNPLFGLEYRKRFWSGELEIDGTITQEQEFDNDGNLFGDDSTRTSLFAKGEFRINDYWNWGFGAERVSDDEYLRRYGISGAGEQRGPYIGDRSRLISQLFAIGQDERSFTQVSFVNFQDISETADQSVYLPNVLPYFDAERVFADPWLGGQLRLQSNAVMLQRDEDPATIGEVEEDTARLSLSAMWRKDMTFGPGLVFSPFGQARGDIYHVETSQDQFDTFSRVLGLGGAEISWPFLRAGENFDLVIEPIAMAAYASDEADDPRIINEDSLTFELDDSNLFRPNAAPNYDLWEPGGRVSLGLRATARARTGQSASLMFGRRWRSETATSPILGADGLPSAAAYRPASNLDEKASDWVGAIQTDLGRNFGADVRFRLEDDSFELQRLDASVRGSIGRIYASARYYSVDAAFLPAPGPGQPPTPSSELSGDLGIDLARGWRAQFGVVRDLDNDINLRQEISAIYEDDCTFLEITYSRSETNTGLLGPSDGVQIRFGLTSLGMFGGD
jgi:LPS-assembly protein